MSYTVTLDDYYGHSTIEWEGEDEKEGMEYLKSMVCEDYDLMAYLEKVNGDEWELIEEVVWFEDEEAWEKAHPDDIILN